MKYETKDGLFDPHDPYNAFVEYDVPETLEEAEIRYRESQAQILGYIMMDLAESAVPRESYYEPEADVPSTNSQEASPQDWLFVEDIREMFGCGDSKARGILRALPSVRIGRRTAVMRKDLEAYIEEHGGVVAKWPKRKR